MRRRVRLLIARVAGFFTRARRTREFDDELTCHIQLHTDELVRRGQSAADARRAALVRFGAVEATREQYRDEGGLPLIEMTVRDVRSGLRAWRRSPGLAAVVIASLALGIGANTAIFSVVNAVLLKPVALPDPDRLVLFMNVTPQGSGSAASPAKFALYRQQSAIADDVSAFRLGQVNLTGGGFPEQVRWGQVSRDFFTLMGARTVVGRTFTADEDRPRGPKAAVIDKGLWVTRFHNDPDIAGQSISLGGEPYAIVGVLDTFDFRELGRTPQVWTPFQLDPNTTDQGHYFRAAGRLKPGVSLKQANAQMAAAAAAFRAKFPNALGPAASFGVQRIRDVLVDNVRTSLFVLVGAVGLVLLIACANVANLLLIRATGRRRETAIRAALGGSRSRLVRQLLTESLVLSLGGGLLGLGLGWIGIRALLAVNTAGLPRVGPDGSFVTIDWRVGLFTLLVSLATGVLFGLVPALQGSKVDLAGTLKESGGRSGSGARHNRARSVLVVVEVALALVLLVGSGLLIRTAVALSHVDPGFDAHHVLTMNMSFTGPQFQKAEAVQQLITTGADRLRTIPGVALVSATCCVPLQGGYGLSFRIVGRPLDPNSQGPFHGGGGWMTVSPGYFEVFRIPVRRGRTFTDRDTAGATPVVVINEAMARQFWPTSDPLADRLLIGKGVMREFAAETDRQIVGVVADTRDNGLDTDPQPQMFIPQAQVPDAANALNEALSPMSWIVRTEADPHQLSATIEQHLREATGLPVSDVHTMDDIVSLSTSRQTFNMWLMAVFGGAALLLAAIGIYGLMAYAVEQRTQEIGIRLALGAEVSQVKRLVVGQGLGLAAIGVGIGLASAFGLARLMTTLLFGVTTHDPLVFAGVPALLTLVALAAVWIPARRASLVDPIVALRSEE